MRLLKILIGLFLILAMAVLLNYNSDQVVTIWLYPGKILQDINLATTLVGTLGLGIVICFVIGLIQIFGQQREIMRQSSQLKKLRTELNNLRHSGLDETDVFMPGAPETSEDEKPIILPAVVDPEK